MTEEEKESKFSSLHKNIKMDGYCMEDKLPTTSGTITYSIQPVSRDQKGKTFCSD